MGRIRSSPVNWAQWDHLVGVIPDKVLAEQSGIRVDTIKARRLRTGKQPVLKSGWTASDDLLLVEGQQQCRLCKELKPITSFRADSTGRSGFKRTCRFCCSRLAREKRQGSKTIWLTQLGSSCQNCGFKEHISALQFHHVNGQKEFNPSSLVTGSKDEAKILKELNLCCVLCANCHYAFHGGELPLRFKKRSLRGWTVLKEI